MERQSLIFRIGQEDRAEIRTAANARITEVQFVDETGGLGFGIGQTISDIEEEGLQVTEIGIDLVVLASAVYAADKRLCRAEISQDGWTREIDIYLPVSQPALWDSLRVHLEKMLGFLTGDLWRFSFRAHRGNRRRLREITRRLGDLTPSDVCLFSGGLDSFIGAVDLLQEERTPLLMSHSWVTSDSNHQSDCLKALQHEYGRESCRQVRSRIGFGERDLHITSSGEKTQRSRSFLFFAIGTAATSGLSIPLPIVVPENGLISLNIPLDPLRLGAFSTRTTHPYFLARYNELLRALGIHSRLMNPYRHQTKGEMVVGCKNSDLLETAVGHTLSCSAEDKLRWQGESPGHCGYCVPCIIRRASLLKLGIPDPTRYTVDLLDGKTHRSDQSQGEHARSFLVAINRLKRSPESAPVAVQRAGPLSDYFAELTLFADMYRRGMGEVEQLLQNVRIAPHA